MSVALASICRRGSDYHPRYRAAHVIGRTDKVRTDRIVRFDPAEIATAWIAEMRAGQAVCP